MKCSSEAADPSDIIAEMLKDAGEEGVGLVRKLVEAVSSSDMIPVDCEESFIQNLYKGKGEALDHGNYRGLKLTDQVMKLLERVLNSPQLPNAEHGQDAVHLCPWWKYNWCHLHCWPAAGDVHHRH